MRTTTWVIIAALAGCKGKEAAPAAAPGSATPAPVAPPVAPLDASADVPVAVAVVDAPVPGDAARDPRCTSPCLFLAEAPLDKVLSEKLVETQCAGATLFTDDGDCDEKLYALNCIYAAHGKVFKTAAWKDKFRPHGWYKPNTAFKDSELPALALANVRALKEQYNVCKASTTTVDPKDIEIANAFVQEVATAIDDADLPEHARGLELRNMHVTDDTTYSYARPPTADRREVTVTGLYHAVGGGEAMPDATVTVVIEGDKVVDAR